MPFIGSCSFRHLFKNHINFFVNMIKSKKFGRKRSIPITSGSNPIGEAQCLKELKLLVKGDKDLAKFAAIFDDQFLLHFVRGRKCRVQESFMTLKNYIKVRKEKYPEIFKPLQPSKSLRQKDFARILRNRDDQGRLVLVGYAKHWDPRTCSADELIGQISLYADELMNWESVSKFGVVLIMDMTGYGLKHAKTVTPFNTHKLVNIFHSSLPVKMKGNHVINEMYLFNIVAKSLLKLLPKKIQDRLHFHSNNVASLHKHISPNILPKSMGGKLSEEEALQDLEELGNKLILKEDYYKTLAELLYR